MYIISIMTLLYPLSHLELLLHLWQWGTIIRYYDNYKTLCALALCHNGSGYNTHNGHKIFPLISTHKSGVLCWILVLTGGKHSYIQGPGIGAKVLWKLNGVCTSFLAYSPPTPASTWSTVFEPPQVSDEDDTDPHILAKIYMRYALPEESSGISTAHAELTIAWPKHGYALRSHGTFLHALSRAATP